jgi:hypothetical protein
VFGPGFVSIFGEGCAGDVNHLNPFNPDPQCWTNVSPAIGRAMASIALTNLPYASRIQPGSFAVRSTTNYEPTTCPLEQDCGERLVASAVKLLNELKK